MSAFFLCSLGIPRTTLPVFAVGRSRLVKAFPPHGVVVEISAHIGVYGILLGSHQGVVVGLAVGARSYSEEAVFRIDGIKSSVFAYTEPGDVVAEIPLFTLIGATELVSELKILESLRGAPFTAEQGQRALRSLALIEDIVRLPAQTDLGKRSI